jgi:hypothetical protein
MLHLTKHFLNRSALIPISKEAEAPTSPCDTNIQNILTADQDFGDGGDEVSSRQHQVPAQSPTPSINEDVSRALVVRVG